MSINKPTHVQISRGLVRRFLRAAKGVTISVLGDVMLDRYIKGEVWRISPEAPIPVVSVRSETMVPGGAANVACNLAELGIGVRMCGVIGADSDGAHLRALLEEKGIDCSSLLAVPGRPTAVKSRVMAQGQQLVRVDREDTRPLAKGLSKRLIAELARGTPEHQGIILADYAKGVISQFLFDRVKSFCRESGMWLSVDPKPKRAMEMPGVSLLTPNRKELFELAERPYSPPTTTVLEDEGLLRAIAAVQERYHPRVLLVTISDQGMLLCEEGKAPVLFPAMAREVFDVSGAGDTVIAIFTAAMVSGSSLVEAALLANHAAGIVVGKLGTATIKPRELMEAVETRSARPDRGGRREDQRD